MSRLNQTKKDRAWLPPLAYPCRRGLALALALALMVIGVLVGPAHALHRESKPVTRLTQGSNHVHTPGRHFSVRALAFSSDVDLLQNGSTGRQIFIFDLLAYDCNRFTTEPNTPCPRPRSAPLLQITHGPGSPDNPSLVFSSTTQYIAFDADGSFGGGTGPAAQHRQIFLENLTTGEVVRVTNSADGDSVRPSINGSGTIVTFESTAPLAGRTDLTGIPQIFSYRRQFKLRTGQLIQLTAGRGPSLHPSPNLGGNQIAFQSTANLTGDGFDTGIDQIFVANIDWTTQTFGLVQLTAGNASSIRPYITDKVNVLVFESPATSFGSASVGPGNEIYMVPTDQGPLPPIQQLTTFDPYGDCSFPAMNALGDGVAMICSGDPLENGTSGRRAFVLALGGPQGVDILYQITGRGDVPGPIGLYMGRNFLTLADNTDLTGSGFCGDQLYIIDFFKDDKTGKEFYHAASLPQDLPGDLVPAPSPSPSPITNMIGNHTFALNAGEPAHGTQLAMKTQATNAAIEITDVGQLRLQIGARDLDTGEAPVTVLTDNQATQLPPTQLPGLGTLCIAATGVPGSGILDCDGGRDGGDLLLQQFHGGDPANPGCVGGCIESKTSTTCRGPHTGVCRGPIDTLRSGFFTPGGMQISFPATISISVFDGLDGLPCTADDDYTITNMPMDMQFTTGNLSGTIVHADTSNGILTNSATGIPFDCDDLVADQLQGTRMVGVVPLLDVPYVNGTVSDILLTYRLEASVDNAHGQCNPTICTSPQDCDDGNPSNGQEDCQNETCLPGTPPCDDGNPCNGVETVDPVNGGCIPGTPPDCGDGDLCTTDTCNPTVGCIHTPLCDDGNVCNGIETCNPTNGACSAGTHLSCDDGNPCTDDSCNATLGCVHLDTTRCDDGNACNGDETCNPATGACVAGTPPDCNDGDLCTIDSCSPTDGCVHASKCDNGNACDGSETCDPATGTCGAGTALNCDDNNPCTNDSCTPTGGCIHTSKCDDGNACNGVETCDPTTGTCGTGTPPNCNDNNLCTVDACSPALGCTHTLGCDDGNACTDDTCDPAVGCQHTSNAARCDDHNLCTDDTCDPTVGCKHTNNTKPCNDGSVCTTGDTCQNGSCHGTSACNDGNDCNGIETCDAQTGACHGVAPPLPFLLVFSCEMNELSTELNPLVAALQAADPASVGGKFRQKLLVSRVRGAQVKLLALSTRVKAAVANLKNAQFKLHSFQAALRTGMLSGRISRSVAEPLLDTVTGVMTKLDALRLEIPT